MINSQTLEASLNALALPSSTGYLNDFDSGAYFTNTNDPNINVARVSDVWSYAVGNGGDQYVILDKVNGFAENILPKSVEPIVFYNVRISLTDQEREDEVKQALGIDFIYDKSLLNYGVKQVDTFIQFFDFLNTFFYVIFTPPTEYTGTQTTQKINYDTNTGAIISDVTNTIDIFGVLENETIILAENEEGYASNGNIGSKEIITRDITETVHTDNPFFQTFTNFTIFEEWNKQVYKLQEIKPISGVENTYDYSVKEFITGDGFDLVAPAPTIDEGNGLYRNTITWQRNLSKIKEFSSIQDLYTLLQVPY